MPTKYKWLIAGGALAVLGAVIVAWPHLDPPVRAALISGVVTALAALLGASLLVWQIGTQAKSAIAANRTTEALKLKKDVYLELVKACREASNAQIDVTSYILQFELAITQARSSVSLGFPVQPPAARARQLMELYSAAGSKTTELIMVQERWEIIDPRTAIFRQAFGHAHHELMAAWGKYFEMTLQYMPHPAPDGTTPPWQVPDPQAQASITALGDGMRHAYDLYGCYIYDLQKEMQNALLGELFEPNRVPLRDAPDPTFRTIRLDMIPELEAFFASTPMGINRIKVEAEARARFAESE